MDGRRYNIKSGSFMMMTEDDIHYLTTISKLFQRGILTIDPAEEEFIQSNPCLVEGLTYLPDDEMIKDYLTGNIKHLQSWLDTVTDPIALDRVYDVVETLDLPESKMRILRQKLAPYFTYVD